MTVDLKAARVGSVVEFRCGGKIVITPYAKAGAGEVRMVGQGQHLWWHDDGRFTSGEHPLDIIAIIPPPMTDAERLAEIVDIVLRNCSPAVLDQLAEQGNSASISALSLQRILELARGWFEGDPNSPAAKGFQEIVEIAETAKTVGCITND